MESFKRVLFKWLGPLFNTRAAGAYLLIFAAAIGYATFIENDYGTPAAQKLIYRAQWFELLLILFSITLIVNIVKYKFIRQKKWALVLFHGAMVIILVGAGITRYFGYEGMMHIRQGASSNTFLSAETYLNFNVWQNGQEYSFYEPVLFAGVGNNHFDESYQIGNQLIEVELEKVVPNPKNVLETAPDGKPILKVVFGSSAGREEYYVVEGEERTINGVHFNFTDQDIPGSFQIQYRNNTLEARADETYQRTVMATQTTDTISAGSEYTPLSLRALYSNGSSGFVFGDFVASGRFTVQSEGPKITSGSNLALHMKVRIDGQEVTKSVVGYKGGRGRPTVYEAGDTRLAISYGSRSIQLPFSIGLREFIMERYPGTNSAASYASEVTLLDNRNGMNDDFRIYMNNILNYDGYRFFQSSYDRDELGTYLSVNHDFWGTWVSYLGYALLTLGLVMTFFSKNTRFSQLALKLQKMRNARLIMIPLLIGLITQNEANAQSEVLPNMHVVSQQHAGLFSRIMVQDHRGRIKPMHTLNRELMRKVNGSEKLQDWTADQVILSMYAEKTQWYAYPMIRLGKHEKVGQLLGVQGEMASYKDFFTIEGQYKLRDEVNRANNLEPIDRGVFEKQLLKVDERVNIMGMIFAGSLLNVVPLPGDANNTWISEHVHGNQQQGSEVAQRLFPAYRSALHKALHEGDEELANKVLTELAEYQRRAGASIMPSETKIDAEILLNNSKVFNRLALWYILLGLAFLVLLFVSVFKPDWNFRKVAMFLMVLASIGFIFHTVGLGVRWYVSGRAPWSNGYESMIYIAWTATLAGSVFTRRALGAMAATLILSGTVLLIALLSYLDPEITPLVPVLKSYWLTIHVSLEAGSYGFLMLGAIIGLINLVLMATLTQNNLSRVKRIVKELSYISEMILIAGLVMISIGTYLGGVWANESWGRYWGWDAKETWALVSILVYSFILHMRIIPKMDGLFTFNFASLFGLASIIMTYFGVNYYLSGLHSYAAGDPVPVPDWVYISVVCVLIISALAYWRKRVVWGK